MITVNKHLTAPVSALALRLAFAALASPSFAQRSEEGALCGTTLSGHPRHVLPVEINLLGFLAGKGTEAQKKPAQRQKYDRGIGIGH